MDGKKVKFKKGDCISPNKWIVGKGCFSPSPKRAKTPSPKRAKTPSPKRVTPHTKKDINHDCVFPTKVAISKFLNQFGVSFNPNLINARIDEILYNIVFDKYYLDLDRAINFAYMITAGTKLSDAKINKLVDFIYTLDKK